MKPRTEKLDLGSGDYLFGDYLGRRLEIMKSDGRWTVPVSDELVYYVEEHE